MTIKLIGRTCVNAQTAVAGKAVPPMSGKAVDPICGMPVDPAKSAGSSEYKGATYHFCSIRCLDKFKDDPDNFVARAAPKMRR